MAKIDNLLKVIRNLQGGPKPLQRSGGVVKNRFELHNPSGGGYTPPGGPGYVDRSQLNLYDSTQELDDVSLYLGGGPARAERKGNYIRRNSTENYELNRPFRSEVEDRYPTTDEILQWIKDNQ